MISNIYPNDDPDTGSEKNPEPFEITKRCVLC